MSSYRVSGVTQAYYAPTISLSHARGAELENELTDARKKYEQLLEESFLHNYFDAFRITVFGSSRTDPESPDFKFIENLTKQIGLKFDVEIVTGGGGGMMLAANQGLAEAIQLEKKRRKNVVDENRGILVNLPHEENRNPYLDHAERFDNFSTRLEEFVRRSNGIYLAPGGIGTELEAALFMQLKQLGKLEHNFPILAHPFWKPMIRYENHRMFDEQLRLGKEALISEQDLQIVQFTDDVDFIVQTFAEYHEEWQRLKKKVSYVDEPHAVSAKALLLKK